MYVATSYLVAFVLKSVFKIEMLGAADELFFLDDHRNRFNIVAFHKYKKIQDVDHFRNTMLQRAMKYPRLKSTVVKFLGKFMFKQIPEQEVLSQVDKILPVIGGIHNEEQLIEFMAE